MHVFITGAGGFVGGHLQRRLRSAGNEITAVDLAVDVTDPKSIATAIARADPDAVIHLAAQSSVAASFDDPMSAFRVNYLGTLNLLNAVAAHAPGARVLLIGSSDCYGDVNPDGTPISELEPLRPASPYARSKAAAEQLGAAASADGPGGGLDVVRIRAFTHIGPGQSDRFVVASFARQVTEIGLGRREPRLQVGNLDSVRDFLDVRDVVDAYARMLEPDVPADVYNVASGVGVQLRSLLDELSSLAGVSPSIQVDPERFRPTDRRVGDASRLAAVSGWRPTLPLAQTLRDVLAFWHDALSAPA